MSAQVGTGTELFTSVFTSEKHWEERNHVTLGHQLNSRTIAKHGNEDNMN